MQYKYERIKNLRIWAIINALIILALISGCNKLSMITVVPVVKPGANPASYEDKKGKTVTLYIYKLSNNKYFEPLTYKEFQDNKENPFKEDQIGNFEKWPVHPGRKNAFKLIDYNKDEKYLAVLTEFIDDKDENEIVWKQIVDLTTVKGGQVELHIEGKKLQLKFTPKK